MYICRSLLGLRVQRTKAAIDHLCTRKVMIADRLAERPRATVNHQPELVFLVGLKLEKVVPAAQSCELQRTLVSPERLEPGTAQFNGIDLLRLPNDGLPVSTPARDCLGESRQNLASGFWIKQPICAGVRCHGKHSTADVTAHCLRVNQSRGCQNHSHTDVVSQ